MNHFINSSNRKNFFQCPQILSNTLNVSLVWLLNAGRSFFKLLAIAWHLAQNFCVFWGIVGLVNQGRKRQVQFWGLVELLSRFDSFLLKNVLKLKTRNQKRSSIGWKDGNELTWLIGNVPFVTDVGFLHLQRGLVSTYANTPMPTVKSFPHGFVSTSHKKLALSEVTR